MNFALLAGAIRCRPTMTPTQCADQHAINHHLSGMTQLVARLDSLENTRPIAAAMRVHMELLRKACDRSMGALVTGTLDEPIRE